MQGTVQFFLLILYNELQKHIYFFYSNSCTLLHTLKTLIHINVN